jgi:hypothetical protein
VFARVYTALMAMEFAAQRLQIGDVVLLGLLEQGEEISSRLELPTGGSHLAAPMP